MLVSRIWRVGLPYIQPGSSDRDDSYCSWFGVSWNGCGSSSWAQGCRPLAIQEI